jgi:hypothetical protein
MEEKENGEKKWKEELSVAGSEILKKIRELISQGNVRRIIVKKENGEKIVEIPLTLGAVVGGSLLLFAPFVAAAIAITGLMTKVKLEIIRNDSDKGAQDRK